MTQQINFSGNLTPRLKRGAYRAKLVGRHYIPKGNGKQRPLRISSTEDKLLQTAACYILKAIYASTFVIILLKFRKIGPVTSLLALILP